MKYKILILLVLISFCGLPQAKAAKIASNVSDFVGTWNIYNQNNVLLETLEVELVVAKKKIARFDFKQNSQEDSKKNALKGLIVDSNLVLLNLFDLGMSKTYLAKIDFANGGGAGFQVSTQLAECSLVGKDQNLVLKKDRSRLSEDSEQCNFASFYEGSSTPIKFVKQGVSPALISVTGAIPQSTLDDLSDVESQLSGAWRTKGKGSSRRLLIKNVEANHLGYNFIYRQIDNSTKLLDIAQSSFKSDERIGFYVGNYLVFSTARFLKDEELFAIKVKRNTKLGQGRLLKTPVADCFKLRQPITSTRVCTPADTSSKIDNVTSSFTSRKIQKVNAAVTISF